MVITDAEYGRALNLLKRWDVLDENPLLSGLSDTLDHTEDIIKRLWDGKGDFKQVRDKVRCFLCVQFILFTNSE